MALRRAAAVAWRPAVSALERRGSRRVWRSSCRAWFYACPRPSRPPRRCLSSNLLVCDSCFASDSEEKENVKDGLGGREWPLGGFK